MKNPSMYSKTFLYLIIILLVFHAKVFPRKNELIVNESLKRNGLFFEENLGQIKDQFNKPNNLVSFIGQAHGFSIQIKDYGFSYQIDKILSRNSSKQVIDSTKYRIKSCRIDQFWIGCNKDIKIERKGLGSFTNNYLTGVKPVYHVRNYNSLLLKNVWDGVDISFSFKSGIFEYDFIVTEKKNLDNIKLLIKGAKIINKDSHILLSTPLGIIKEGDLKVIQNGKILKSKFVVCGDTVKFLIDKISPNFSIRIDPPARIWSTYYGGSGDDDINSTSTDNSGNVFVCGTTESAGNIATIGSYQDTYWGSIDGFLVKFNSSGVRQWGTYYGGANNDYGKSCVVDNNGDIYICGHTFSPFNISTLGSHQESFGLFSDAYLIKFNTSGVRLWGTYYGGSMIEIGYCCSPDNNGNIYLVGRTDSGNNISTPGSFKAIPDGFNPEGFIVKFNSLGVRQWGTYYGGNGSDIVTSCSIDNSDNLIITGYTNSSNNISTPGTHQLNLNGSEDGLLAKFNNVGNRIWGTYYGGSGTDYLNSCCVDQSGNIYVAGTTQSSTNITTLGAHQTTYSGADALLARFNTAGNQDWGTYYGYSQSDVGNQCITDGTSAVYLIGTTLSSSLISTPGAYQIAKNFNEDIFISKFSLNGARDYGTYYGGTVSDFGLSGALGSNGVIYLAGSTTSFSLATAGSHQTIAPVGRNGLLIKFCNNPNLLGPIFGSTFVCNNSVQNFSILPVPNVLTYSWTIPAGWTGTSTTNSISVNVGTVGGIIQVNASNTCSLSNTLSLNIVNTTTPAVPSTIFGNTNVCSGSNLTYSVANIPNATQYIWSLPIGWSGSSNTNIILVTSGLNPGSITVASSNLCGTSSNTQLAVNVFTAPSFTSAISGSTFNCTGTVHNYSVANDPNITSYFWNLPFGWSGTSTANIITYTVGSPGGLINMLGSNVCGSSTAQTLNVITNNTVGIILSSNSPICTGANLNFTCAPINFSSFNWSGPNNFSSNVSNPSVINVTSLSSGTYSLNVNDFNGCTSTQSINVNVISVNTIVSVSGGTLSSQQGSATWQWLDCSNNLLPIINETSQSYYSISGGDLAVEINYLGCIDTSACILIAELYDQNQLNKANIFPNPVKERIILINLNEHINYEIVDCFGKVILKGIQEDSNTSIMTSSIPVGVYCLHILSNKGYLKNFKFVKE